MGCSRSGARPVLGLTFQKTNNANFHPLGTVGVLSCQVRSPASFLEQTTWRDHKKTEGQTSHLNTTIPETPRKIYRTTQLSPVNQIVREWWELINWYGLKPLFCFIEQIIDNTDKACVYIPLSQNIRNQHHSQLKIHLQNNRKSYITVH